MAKKIDISISIEELDSWDELTSEEKNLLELAGEMADSAYAPYSNFRVGAALVLENGVIVKGSNQENAAYPSGLCAERVAIFSAGALHPNIPVVTIAIRAKSANFKVEGPVAPCGSCRQVIAEYESNSGKDIRLLLMGESGKIYRVDRLKDLLPFGFMPEALKR